MKQAIGISKKAPSKLKLMVVFLLAITLGKKKGKKNRYQNHHLIPLLDNRSPFPSWQIPLHDIIVI